MHTTSKKKPPVVQINHYGRNIGSCRSRNARNRRDSTNLCFSSARVQQTTTPLAKAKQKQNKEKKEKKKKNKRKKFAPFVLPPHLLKTSFARSNKARNITSRWSNSNGKAKRGKEQKQKGKGPGVELFSRIARSDCACGLGSNLEKKRTTRHLSEGAPEWIVLDGRTWFFYGGPLDLSRSGEAFFSLSPSPSPRHLALTWLT